MWNCDEITLHVCDIHVYVGIHVSKAKVDIGLLSQSHIYFRYLRQGLLINMKCLID